MNLAHVEAVADAILFEGYLLYPYSSRALKNRARWTFGVLCPESDSRQGGGAESSSLVCECLLTGSPQTEVEAVLRFLHPFLREVARVDTGGTWPPVGENALHFVDALEVGERILETSHEAGVVRIDAGPIRLGELETRPVDMPFACDAARELEPVHDGAGNVVAAFVRRRERLEGRLELAAERIGEDTYKLAVRATNVTPAAPVPSPRIDRASLRSFASTHVILGVKSGAFVSMRDPPSMLAAHAAACRQTGAWPVLAGPPGRQDTVLCSPIIVDDHPQVAPESLGDSFDGTEIDELLTLGILALTDEERRRMEAADERTRALLARTDALGVERLPSLHGVFRRSAGDTGAANHPRRLGPGDRVRLRPSGRGDVFDLALAGRAATILSVEEDYESRRYFTVTVDDDPGRDLGALGKPGHRFFFGPDEVEPWDAPSGPPLR